MWGIAAEMCVEPAAEPKVTNVLRRWKGQTRQEEKPFFRIVCRHAAAAEPVHLQLPGRSSVPCTALFASDSTTHVH